MDPRALFVASHGATLERWPIRRPTPRCRATSSASCIAELGSSDGQGAPVPANRREREQDDATGRAAESLPRTTHAGSIFRPGGSVSRWTPTPPFESSRRDPVAKPPPTRYSRPRTISSCRRPTSSTPRLRKERAALEKRRAEFRRDFGRLVSRLQRKTARPPDAQLVIRPRRRSRRRLSSRPRHRQSRASPASTSRKRKRNFATPSSRSSSTIRARCEESRSSSPAWRRT